MAGVSLGSTTQYFANINELMRAGYAELAKEIDADYEQFLDKLKRTEGDIDGIAACLADYLQNDDEIRADAALYAAAIKDPELRALTVQGQQKIKANLCEFVNEQQASAIISFLDGLVIQNSAYDEPVDVAFAAQVIRLLGTAHYDEAVT